MGRRIEERVKEGDMGGTTNPKGHLRNYMETC